MVYSILQEKFAMKLLLGGGVPFVLLLQDIPEHNS